jgi:hypothetical protein
MQCTAKRITVRAMQLKHALTLSHRKNCNLAHLLRHTRMFSFAADNQSTIPRVSESARGSRCISVEFRPLALSTYDIRSELLQRPE